VHPTFSGSPWCNNGTGVANTSGSLWTEPDRPPTPRVGKDLDDHDTAILAYPSTVQLIAKRLPRLEREAKRPIGFLVEVAVTEPPTSSPETSESEQTQ